MFIKDVFKKNNQQVSFIGWLDKDNFMRDSSTLKRIKCHFKEDLSEVKLKVNGQIKDGEVWVDNYEVLSEKFISFQEQRYFYFNTLIKNNFYNFFLDAGYYPTKDFIKYFELKDNSFFIQLKDYELKDVIYNVELMFKYVLSKTIEKKLCNNPKIVFLLKDNYLIKNKNKLLKFVENEVQCGNIVISDKQEEKILPNGVLLLNQIGYSEMLINYLIKEFGNKPFFVEEENKFEMIVPGLGKILEGVLEQNIFKFSFQIDDFIKILELNLKE